MKILPGKKNEGSVLLAATLFIVVVGLVLASYLKLLTNESYIVSRSQSWNQCVPVMEAGVEEAMAEIHSTYIILDYPSNNWILATNGYYQKTRTIGTDGSYYVASIQPVTPPVIYCVAYVPVPGSTQYISREVRVTTQTQQSAFGGVVSKGNVTMKGHSIVDSYDSSLGAYGSQPPGTNGLTLTDSTNVGAINLGGTTGVSGIAVTGPGGTVQIAGSASVSGGIENDANVQIDDVTLPSTTGWSSTYSTGKLGGSSSGPTYDAIFYSGNYALSSLSTSAMAISGNVTIYVSGNFSIGNKGSVYLAPNSKLTIYLANNFSMGSQSTFNDGGTPSSVMLYGLPSCSAVTINAQANFYGQIDAPEAAVTLGAGTAVFGSMVGNSMLFGGGSAVHYDKALGGTLSYIMSSWNEL